MINISYIRLLNAFESFSNAHLQIKRFASDFPEQVPNFGTEKENYPILFVSPNNTIFDENANQFTVDVYCFDIIEKDRININTILSDTNTILNDVYRWFKDGEIFGIDVITDTPTCTPINNGLLDYAAGWQMSITFVVDTYGICEIPFNESPVVITEVCDIVYSQYLTCETLAECPTIIDIQALLPTQDQKDAMDNANGPDATNPFATMADIGGGGTLNLQQVTDNGNTTDNDIQFDAGVGVLLDNGSRLREGTIDAGFGGTKGIAQICAVGYELKWEAGRQYVMDGNGLLIRHSLNNFTTVPSATDDSTKGYYAGSLWTLDNGISYICTDSTIGAAVWVLYDANPQVNSDWNAVSGVAEILNKPTIPAAQVNSDWNATSGVAEILNKPSIPAAQIQSDWNQTNNALLDYIKNKPTIPSVTGFVPYTGATADVDLGTYNLTADHIALNTNPSGAGFVVGATQWNNTIGSSETTLKGGNVVLKNGVDLVARIVNKVTPNATLTKANYTAVRVSGATGGRLSVEYAQANIDLNSADTIGLVCETIATNQEGFILTVGQLLDINTTGSLQGETWADGDVLYLSPTTAGKLTNIKPTGATGHIVVIGYVEYAHAIHGAIYVKIMNGWELDELHNVYINPGTLANNNLLAYESATALWKNKTAANLGIAELASPTFTGTVVLPATTSIGTVSNTEIGYLDGVTSAIQTQLANAGEWKILSSALIAPADSTAYLMPNMATLTPAASTGARVWKFTKSGTVLNVNVAVSQSANGSSEAVTVYLRNNTTATDYLCGTFTMDGGVNANTFANYSVSIPINTTDLWAIKILTPAWVTNPTGVYFSVTIFNKS